MSDFVEHDFAAVTYEFASRLPQTIRSDILIFVVIYATGEFYKGDDLLLRLKNFLLSHPFGLSRFGATLRAISAFDFVIQRAANRAKQAQPMLQSLPEQFPSLSSVALQHPLRKSHFLQALEDWEKIRRDLITPHTLRDFEDRCLKVQSLRQETT
jgi:hypothetical protein